MSKNINTNTAIANIILSDEHEIRLKKKPKKKSNNKKKEALANVKEALRNYDLAVNEAKNKNITLPAELGVLPVKIEEVNSVKELQQLAIKLENMTNQINQLISQGASQARTVGLFQEGMVGQRQGIIPAIQPRVINEQRIPQERPIEIRPIPPIIPSKKPIDPSQIPDDSAEKTLEEIRNEILNKLSPEDKAKAEKEMEDEKPVTPPEPADITPPTTPQSSPQFPDLQPAEKINPADLETNLNVTFGSQTISKLVSPVGFYNIFTDYRRYVKDLVFRTKKITEGEYRLSKDDERILKEEKSRIMNSYDTWLGGLNKPQLQYIDNDAQLLQVNNEMLKELTIDAEVLAQQLLRAQGVTITSFEVGDTATPIEEKAVERLTEKGKVFETRLKQIKDIINESIVKANKTIKPDELENIINSLNFIKTDIDKYERLEPIDKVGLEVLHSEIVDMYNQAQKEVQDKLVEVKQGLPVAPLQELDPFEPIQEETPPRKEAESQPPSPRGEGVTQLDRDINLLNKYVDSISISYSKKIREALQRVPNSKETFDKNEKTRQRTFDTKTRSGDLKKRVKKFLEDEGFRVIKIEMNPLATPPQSPKAQDI
jgi:hypothetical protein